MLRCPQRCNAPLLDRTHRNRLRFAGLVDAGIRFGKPRVGPVDACDRQRSRRDNILAGGNMLTGEAGKRVGIRRQYNDPRRRRLHGKQRFHLLVREGECRGVDDGGASQMAMMQRAIAEPVDQARHAVRRAVDRVDRLAREADALGRAARDVKPVRDVAVDAVAIEWFETAAHRHALRHLPHLGQPQLVAQLELTDEHDLQLPLAAVRVREDPDFLEQRQRQVLGFVDEDDRERLQRRQRADEFVEQVAQLGARRAAQPSGREIFRRDDAELDEDDLEEILARRKRVGDEGAERLAIEIGQHRPAQRRLPGPDVAAEHAQALAAADPRQEIVECRAVRAAVVEERRIGGKAEGLFGEAVERLVRQPPRTRLRVKRDRSFAPLRRPGCVNRHVLAPAPAHDECQCSDGRRRANR